MRLLIIALALALGCTAAPATSSVPPPSAEVSTPPATASPEAAAASSCDEARQRWLLETFFLGYNARTKGAAAVFRFGPNFQYHDTIDGEVVDIRDDRMLVSYLERRWALGDSFDFDLAAIGLSARFPNPTFPFRRTSVQGTYAGNVKFVCEGGLFTGVVMGSVATARSACEETPAARGVPSNANTAAFSRSWWASEDRRIWASRAERMYVGDNKVLWERPVGEKLAVTGQPVGSRDIELEASLPSGYETLDYQASGISFPVAGCWLVVARSGGSELRFVTEVYPGSYVPPRPACTDMAEAVRESWWVVQAELVASSPDRPGFVQQELKVIRAWKGSAPAGHQMQVLQDSATEALLEKGKSYVLFIAPRAYGSPTVVYGHPRINCPQRTIIEVRGDQLASPARYGRTDAIWTGTSLSDLDRELRRLAG